MCWRGMSLLIVRNRVCNLAAVPGKARLSTERVALVNPATGAAAHPTDSERPLTSRDL
jgi:hypothetical protein